MDNKGIFQNKDYKEFIENLKSRIRSSQIKAALSVNQEMLKLYWYIGSEIIKKQRTANWGDGILQQISKDIQKEFPDVKGFSVTNLKYMKLWVKFYSNRPQLVDDLDNTPIFKIPWGHNREIITKTRSVEEALFYVYKTIENNWSRNVLLNQIESGLYERQGKAINNFDISLPEPQSDLAKEILKDPYNFDFLTIKETYNEKQLEDALIENITNFLLELGTGFSYVGRQYKLVIDDEEFYIDLLFYHIRLHSYVVIELKTGKFKPEYAGKLNFYVSAVDDILKTEQDNPMIGILICKERNKTIVEYALRDISKPIGVSQYVLTKSLPEHYRNLLPSIDQLSRELNSLDGE